MTKPHLSNPRARSEIRQRRASVERAERLEQRAAQHGRLTDVERAERKVTGGELQRQITDLAEVLGWDWMEVGPLRTQYGWRTPTRGTLGAGWPDLTLVRVRDRRLIFAELKRELEHPRADQVEVLGRLRSLVFPNCSCGAGRGEPLADWQLFGSQPVDGVRHDPSCRLIGGGARSTDPRIEVFVWRPSDLRDPIEMSRIYEVLR